MASWAVRQGDVWVEKVDPQKAAEVLAVIKAQKVEPTKSTVEGRTVLAYGEVTGHHHSLETETAHRFEIGGMVWLVVDQPTVLEHQEHGPIQLEPGLYEIGIQRQYEPAVYERPVYD